MTRIEILDFSMDKVEKIQENLLDFYDYLKEQKFLALLEKAKMLRKEIGLLKEAEMARKRQQEDLQEQVDALEEELETYKK
ncbi:hypothetical protein [uncultured Selenomonas sp.]|jgi:hypothetical protein|uniref:hypothetical protein n=1 Tax=uncultured Selenomonas sp. TaxID=159275 RepID=UPI0028055BA4|nr:hypothetical protein [uncultured Selenomonas sp.]